MEQKIRYLGIDLIKFVAILSVISVHFLLNTDFYQTPINGQSLKFQVFYRQLFIICVPLFIIVTGYLQSKKEFNKTYLKGILDVILIYLFASIVSIGVRAFYFEEQKTILEWIGTVFDFSAIRYAWYVEMYIGLALLLPFLNKISNSFKDKKEFQIFLGIVIFLTSIASFWSLFNNDILILSSFDLPDYWTAMYPITYYFIGVYIKQHGININPWLSFLYFIGITVLEVILLLWKTGNGTFVNSIGSYNSVLIVFQAIFLFLTFQKVKHPSRKFFQILTIPIVSISTLTLDIFLFSAITDSIIYQYFYEHYFSTQSRNILFAPIIVALSFASAYLLAIVRKIILPLKKTRK